jgi:hypothetical protein
MKHTLKLTLFTCIQALFTHPASAASGPAATVFGGVDNDTPFLMDMVHHNPGEPHFQSAFIDPSTLKKFGYNAQAFSLFESAQFGVGWESYDPDLFEPGSEEKKWIELKRKELDERYDASINAGLEVYCMTDVIVFPKRIIEKHGDAIRNEGGWIDVSLPKTQELLRVLVGEMLDTFPQLSGLIVRTGETYLHDAPFHGGQNPILDVHSSHLPLLNLLRDEVCVKRGKRLIYRTWDFNGFHSDASVYLEITNQIEPHKLLWFSMKHTYSDFWRIGFNPTIGIGKHKQIVEVQCQREYEGKGAHPNFIAGGVIDGFPETTGQGTCSGLREMAQNPRIAGLWTWSRGGGWGGPYIPNELWCEANVAVLAAWGKNPASSVNELTRHYALSKGLSEQDADTFIEICELSAQGVWHGQYSERGDVSIYWTRDDVIGSRQLVESFDKIIATGQVQDYLAEKNKAVAIWKHIEQLAESITSGDESLRAFIKTSCAYGRIKHEIFEQGWIFMLLEQVGNRTGQWDYPRMAQAMRHYDKLWKSWRDLEQEPGCGSLYFEHYHQKQPGIDEAVLRIRERCKKAGEVF